MNKIVLLGGACHFRENARHDETDDTMTFCFHKFKDGAMMLQVGHPLTTLE